LEFENLTDQLKRVLKVSTDAELAEKLGMRANAFANRKRAKSLPWPEIIAALRSRGISLDAGVCGDEVRIRDVTSSYRGGEALDPRLASIQSWLAGWWKRASPDERVWAEVQLRRAFPELAEYLLRGEDRKT